MLSWDVCPTTTIPFSSGNGAHADLDLHVLDPNGYRVINGASYDSGYEIGEITAAVSGYYRFEIQRNGSTRWTEPSVPKVVRSVRPETTPRRHEP